MEKELERPDSDRKGGGGGSQEGKEGGADRETEEEVKRSPKYMHFSLPFYIVVDDRFFIVFSSSLLRTLTSCAVLCQQPAFKSAILDLIQQK